MQMRRFLSALLAGTMILTLAACGNAGAQIQSSAETQETTIPEETDRSEAAAENRSVSSGKTLVVYYSGSGNTKRVAELSGDEEQKMTDNYTTETKISEVQNDPVFGDYGRLIFPVDPGYMSGDTLGDLSLTWYHYIDPDKTVEMECSGLLR